VKSGHTWKIKTHSLGNPYSSSRLLPCCLLVPSFHGENWISQNENWEKYGSIIRSDFTILHIKSHVNPLHNAFTYDLTRHACMWACYTLYVEMEKEMWSGNELEKVRVPPTEREYLNRIPSFILFLFQRVTAAAVSF